MERKTAQEEGYVQITAGEVFLHGNLLIPGQAKGLVAFAHGSGSSRHSPRNQYVAKALRDAGLATLLFDLLTLDEEAEDLISGKQRFDINLLARRLVGATDWLQSNEAARRLRLGYFGASTGAAAALVAAAERADVVGAVVSRGGRPDLAAPVLDRVKAPTLLIVGGNDFPVIDMNREALARIRVEKRLAIIPGATHLFEEPGTLEQVAKLAGEWFIKHLTTET
ncbi:MAG: dienelactone hydrolase family protein [Chloroflexi bacterium]|nr:dienelactone hydrolase family protein [Chloroflexota bacterium]MBI3931693.1 dienelactone hydrolase family protein [Chloroflexota bacterium]